MGVAVVAVVAMMLAVVMPIPVTSAVAERGCYHRQSWVNLTYCPLVWKWDPCSLAARPLLLILVDTAAAVVLVSKRSSILAPLHEGFPPSARRSAMLRGESLTRQSLNNLD